MFIPLHDANYLRHIRLQYVTLALIIINCVVWVAFGTNLVTDEKAVRAAVQRDWLGAKAKEMAEAQYARMLARYSVQRPDLSAIEVQRR